VPSVIGKDGPLTGFAGAFSASRRSDRARRGATCERCKLAYREFTSVTMPLQEPALGLQLFQPMEPRRFCRTADCFPCSAAPRRSAPGGRS
jgi:hypothetical protein